MQLLLSYPDPFYFWVSLPITKQQQQYNLGTTTSRVDCWAGSTSEEEPTTQNYLCNRHSGHLDTKMIILPSDYVGYLVRLKKKTYVTNLIQTLKNNIR